MRIQSTNTKNIYEFEPNKLGGEDRSICPECSHLRKKSKDKCLAWDVINKRGYCHNCNASFFEYRPYEIKKEYVVPEWKNITKLTDDVVKWFTGRMISQNTLVGMKIYSDNEFMPQDDKIVEVICFPYFRNDKLVNIKYRGKGKTFKLVKGSELVFYNIDAILNQDSAIICEGEIDCLTFIENGFDNCLSVPNGANKNTEYIDNSIHYFDNINKIYIAVDQDAKGLELRDELVRRIGAEKCWLVNFKDCKDANEYFVKYGGIEFKKVLDESKPVPVKGIVDIKNLYANIKTFFEVGIQKGKELGIESIDKFITWETSRLAICTGIPASGKSEFVDYLVCKLNIVHGWKTAYFTPENYPLHYHYSKLYEKFIGKSFHVSKSNEAEFDMAFEYISNNFFYILDEENFTLDGILASAKSLVKHKGIKVVVIDPYNKIDHKIKSNINETTYISEFLDKLILFGKLNDVLIILIAHPTKMLKNEIPNLYSISGSAHFYNKCDYGFTVNRVTNEDNIMMNEIDVYWQKIKFKHLGEQGISSLMYNYNNGRFEEKTNDGIHGWDNTNWLIKNKNNELNWKQDGEVPF